MISIPSSPASTKVGATAKATRSTLCFGCGSAFAGLLALTTVPAFAQNNDIVPAKTQSDSQVSVWVNNASLDLFVEQLASLTGRDVSIEGDLQGQVSGNFNGSMLDTLGEVSEQLPVLFDLDDKTLGAVPVAMSESYTIALNDSVLDAPMLKAMLVDLLPGNAVQFDNEQVIVSGHPDFVERTVAKVSQAMAETNPEDPAVISDQDNEPAEPTVNLGQAVSDQDAVVDANEVSDLASSVNAGADADVNADSGITAATDDEMQSASDTATSTDRTVRWVTDIPGFDTF